MTIIKLIIRKKKLNSTLKNYRNECQTLKVENYAASKVF